MPSPHYDVHEVIVTARPVAGVHAQISRGRVAQEFGRHLDQVYAAGRVGAVVPLETLHGADGPPAPWRAPSRRACVEILRSRASSANPN